MCGIGGFILAAELIRAIGQVSYEFLTYRCCMNKRIHDPLLNSEHTETSAHTKNQLPVDKTIQ